MEAVVECSHLGKTYPSGAVALDNVTLSVGAGESFGLLGENGAGKSTLVRLLMGFIHPSAGEMRLLGEADVRRARPHVGYVPEHQSFEPRLTARRYLGYMAELSGLFGSARNGRVAVVLEEVGLGPAADRRLNTYSKGMLQRVGLAQALLGDPALLILDEPTDGLDPASRRQVRESLQRLHGRGVALLICSHDLAEVEALCSSVGMLRAGTLVTAGRVSDLRTSHGVTEIELAAEHDAEAVIESCSLRSSILTVDGNSFRIPTTQQRAVLRVLVAADISIRSLNTVRETLEDVYLRTMRVPDAGMTS